MSTIRAVILDVLRDHRIGSPTEPSRVAGDRPLECTLCHTDKSVESLVIATGKWGVSGTTAPRSAGATAMISASTRFERHWPAASLTAKAVAIAMLGESRDRAALPVLAPLLAPTHTRSSATTRSVRSRQWCVAVNAPAAEVLRTTEAWLESVR